MAARGISALLDQSTIGKTLTKAFTSAAASFQLQSDTSKLPGVFWIYTDEDCYVRQGGSAVAATTSDMLLKASTYIQVVVRKPAESYISVLRVTTNGTLRATEASSYDPGTGASGAAA